MMIWSSIILAVIGSGFIISQLDTSTFKLKEDADGCSFLWCPLLNVIAFIQSFLVWGEDDMLHFHCNPPFNTIMGIIVLATIIIEVRSWKNP